MVPNNRRPARQTFPATRIGRLRRRPPLALTCFLVLNFTERELRLVILQG